MMVLNGLKNYQGKIYYEKANTQKSPLYYELNTNKKNIKFNYIFNE